ncbi:60S ribosomal protein L10a-like [Pararge aegeria]|uniref:Jg29 protein n=1 Tax=Pararge aegeria aegeria TaxID=348720 RepID=A0A8S4QZL8_9NEOP|nr:60S ribosomal protein L10a-like [Pararge aegeria]CAH2219766.1 jg29 [Pararge aegeria aegeria]
MTKISRDTINECVKAVLVTSKDERSNMFEIIELQVVLKNSAPNKDSRFGGSSRPKCVKRQKVQAIESGDQQNGDTAKTVALPNMDLEALKNIYRTRRLAKSLAKKYSSFLASQPIMKLIPLLLDLGPNTTAKFSSVLSYQDTINDKIEAVREQNQMRKNFRLSIAIGHDNMTPEELANQLSLSVDFLVSLLKKSWHNVRSLHIKSAMGEPLKLY